MWGKSKQSGTKTRSNNAMFGGESLVQQQERVQVEQEYADRKKQKSKNFIEIPYLNQ
jgi:hypothetical protein